jgi:hypothetical protein
MDANSFVEGLLTGYTLELLSGLGLGAAALVGILKARFRPSGTNILWGDVVLSSLLAFAAVCLILFALTGHGIAYKPITSANVKSHIKLWMRSMGKEYNAQDDEKSPNNKLDLGVHGSSIGLFVDSDEYIKIALDISNPLLLKLSPSQKQHINDMVQIQVAELGIASAWGPGPPNDKWEYLGIYKEIPISETITKESFLNAVEQVQRAGIIMKNNLDKDLNHEN